MFCITQHTSRSNLNMKQNALLISMCLHMYFCNLILHDTVHFTILWKILLSCNVKLEFPSLSMWAILVLASTQKIALLITTRTPVFTAVINMKQNYTYRRLTRTRKAYWAPKNTSLCAPHTLNYKLHNTQREGTTARTGTWRPSGKTDDRCQLKAHKSNFNNFIKLNVTADKSLLTSS